MSGETLNAPPAMDSAAATTPRLPTNLLYSIFSRIGDIGLGTEAFEKLRASHRGGFLGKAIAYDNWQKEIPRKLIQSLRFHPVRLISFIDRPYYYGAKRKYIAWIASRHLETGRYDFFHSWSGDSLRALRVTKKLGIPSLIEIPTWHCDRGNQARPQVSRSPGLRHWKENLLVDRSQLLEEYELADLLMVFSQKAAESFRAQGFPEEKIFYRPNGVDVQRFQPGPRPPIFRAVFAGALIERKGIHVVLEAWHRLNLKDAELWLVGAVHDEAKPYLKKFWRDNIKVVGFARDLQNYLRQGTIFVFPSRLDANAKTVTEAAASGLALITTREATDVTNEGVEGLIVPPNDPSAVAEAILHLYNHPEIVDKMRSAARKRAVENFTWEHCRAGVLKAYERAIQLAR